MNLHVSSTDRIRRICGSILLSICVASCTAGDTIESSPPSDPGDSNTSPFGPDYLATPVGYIHRSCVYEVDDGATVDEAGNVQHADGSTFRAAPCAYPTYPNLSATGEFAPMADVAPTVNGWVTAGIKEHATGYKSFHATQHVPKAPTHNGATVFLFPALEPCDGSRIVQPVLEWSATGNNRWQISSWAGSAGGPYYHSTPRDVNVGDRIDGHLDKVSTGYNIWTDDVTSNKPTSLRFNTVKTYDCAFVTLEAYSVSNCDQYPDQTSMQTYTTVVTAGGSLSTTDWKGLNWNVSPSCGRNTPRTNYLQAINEWSP
jgi:hypothetical protein